MMLACLYCGGDGFLLVQHEYIINCCTVADGLQTAVTVACAQASTVSRRRSMSQFGD